MDKKFDESLDHIIRNDDDKIFVEPYGADGVWLSIQAQRSAGVTSVGTSMPVAQAIQLRNSLNFILAGLALPVFTVTVVGIKNHEYAIDVHATDEDAAIDCVLDQTYDDLRSLRCGEIEVVL